MGKKEIEWGKKKVLKPWLEIVEAKGKSLELPIINFARLPKPLVLSLMKLIVTDFMGRKATMLTIVRNGAKNSYFHEKIDDGKVSFVKRLSSEEAKKAKRIYVKTADSGFFQLLMEADKKSRGDNRRYVAGILYAFLEALRHNLITFEPEFPAFRALKALSRSFEIDRDQLSDLLSNFEFSAEFSIVEEKDFGIRIKWRKKIVLEEADPPLKIGWKPLSRALSQACRKDTTPEIYEEAVSGVFRLVREGEGWQVRGFPDGIRKHFLKQLSPNVPSKLKKNLASLFGYKSRFLILVYGKKPIFGGIATFEKGRFSSFRNIELMRKKSFSPKKAENYLKSLKRAESRKGFITMAMGVREETLRKLLSSNPFEQFDTAISIEKTIKDVIFYPETPFVQQLRQMSGVGVYLRLLVPFLAE